MTNLLLFLVLLTCLGIAVAWVAEHPGVVTIHWFDYRIDTSLAFLLMIVLIVAGIAAYAWLLIRGLILAPSRLGTRRGLLQYRKGLAQLTHSVAALAAADIKSAEIHTRKAEKLLGSTPLTLLLSAQIARSQGDDAKTRVLLEQMLEHKETEYVAARSLSEAAGKQRLFPKALALAQRAHSLNPKGISHVVALHVHLGQWQEALHAIERAARRGHISRAERRRHKGIVHLQQGMQLLEDGKPDIALRVARHTLKELPGFAPAIIFASRAFAAAGQPRKGINLIIHAWKTSPHPQLAEALGTIIAKEPKDKQIHWIRKLAARNAASPESDMALAQAAIKRKDWDTARKALKSALAREESARACKLMAEVEQTQYGDLDAVNKWQARAAAAPDTSWTCRGCGHTAAQWNAHCPSCNAFDTLEWKKREIKFAA